MLHIVQKVRTVVSAVIPKNKVAHGVNHKDGTVLVTGACLTGKGIAAIRPVEGNNAGMVCGIGYATIRHHKASAHPVGITVKPPVHTSGDLKPLPARLFAVIGRHNNPPLGILVLWKEAPGKWFIIRCIQIQVRNAILRINEFAVIGG